MSGHAASAPDRRPPPPAAGRASRRPTALAILCLALSLLLPLAVNSQAVDPNLAVTIAKKLELLQRYLGSSGAQKIAAGDNATAQELLGRANERAEQALHSYNRGDMQVADERLAEAFRAYSEALEVQRGKRTGQAEIRQQNAALRDEIGAYLQAFDEALLAKGPAAAGLLNRGRVDELLAQAHGLEQAGDPQAAREQLKEAYNLAITALTRVRDNETVVYNLDFRTPADEYRYEQNRNQSYAMLVEQMRQSSEYNEQALKLAERYRDEGEKLRQEAEALAASGQFEAAIKTMEEASKRLVRSLQMMGLSIPG